jgi:hypothetical protein
VAVGPLEAREAQVRREAEPAEVLEAVVVVVVAAAVGVVAAAAGEPRRVVLLSD